MAPVALVGALVAGDRDLLRVHDDDEVAGVAVRRVLRLALAAQRVGDLGRQPPEGLALGVDDVPVTLAVGGCRYVGLHRTAPVGVRKAAPENARSGRGRSDVSHSASRWTRSWAQVYTARRKPAESRAVRRRERGNRWNGVEHRSRGESGTGPARSAALSARARQLTPQAREREARSGCRPRAPRQRRGWQNHRISVVVAIVVAGSLIAAGPAAAQTGAALQAHRRGGEAPPHLLRRQAQAEGLLRRSPARPPPTSWSRSSTGRRASR